MATSVDGGKTCRCLVTMDCGHMLTPFAGTKYANNPLLSEEPPEIHVTGFRDPFLAPWPAMDKLRGTPGKLYGLISGGIHDLGPRTFLYEVDPKDLTKWTYLHPLTTDVPVGYLPSVKWAGDFGANWECTNFVSLRAHDGTQRELVFTGTEGGKHRPWRDEHYRKQSQEAPRRDPSYANWFIGNLAAAGATSEVRMDIGPTGMIDWGVFYASSSFPAPDGRTVVWGWMQEPDVSDGLLKERGWTGCMGIPREIYLQEISGVIGAFSSPLDTIASFGLEPQTGASSDAHTVYTLGIRPIIETDQLRKDIVYDHPAGPINSTVRCFKTLPAACEIRCILEISKATKDVSFILRHNDDLSIKTSIVFDPHAETLQVIRELSTDRTDISTAPEIGSHTLLRLQSGDGTEERFEPLRLTIYLDHDVIELFANDRFALSTRVYTPPQYTGFSIAAKGDVEVQDLKVWEMGSMGLVR